MAKPLQLLALLFLLLIGTVAHAAPRCTLTGDARVAVGDRSVLIHLPQGQAPATPAPLVILLHGSGGTGAAMLRDSQLAEASDKHGFLVAAPDAGIAHDKGFVWNIPGVPTVAGNIPGADAPDDVKFIGALIDQLARAGCADPARVYATGLSGGGRMTSWLGCIAADRFAAIAPVVGLRAGNPVRRRSTGRMRPHRRSPASAPRPARW